MTEIIKVTMAWPLSLEAWTCFVPSRLVSANIHCLRCENVLRSEKRHPYRIWAFNTSSWIKLIIHTESCLPQSKSLFINLDVSLCPVI